MSAKEEQFDPTEEQIQAVLKKTDSDPRKLAIAYLRAKERARQANMTTGFMESIQELTLGAFTGDEDRIKNATKEAERVSRASREKA